MDTIQEKIRETMAITFGIDKSDIDESSSMDSIENWDSIKHMNLVVSLEENFKIEFDDQEIVELLNFKLIDSIVRSKVGP